MKKERIANFFISFILLIAVFSAGYITGQSRWAPVNLTVATSQTPPEAREAFVPFWEVWTAVNTDYFAQPLDPNVLVEGAIEGMLATLDDPNTAYLSPQEQEAAENSMDGELQGIGAEVQSAEDGSIVIVSPFEGSPADKAGLRPLDIIREADGTPLTGMDVGDAAALVRGPAGTDVHLVIERDGEQFEVTITRGVITIPSVRHEMLEEGLAYIRLSRFGTNTTADLNTALEELMPQSPQGLILDLRRNPGGSLRTVVDIADEFLPEGTVLIERFGDGEEVVFEATEEGQAEEIPLVVLIDVGSASASEVLAGAIRDTGRGTLIGQTSFGKGTVQNWIPLRNGGGVRITVARWLTPEGAWIHETGITPDVIVGLPTGEGEEFRDTQLDAAIEFLLDNQNASRE